MPWFWAGFRHFVPYLSPKLILIRSWDELKFVMMMKYPHASRWTRELFDWELRFGISVYMSYISSILVCPVHLITFLDCKRDQCLRWYFGCAALFFLRSVYRGAPVELHPDCYFFCLGILLGLRKLQIFLPIGHLLIIFLVLFSFLLLCARCDWNVLGGYKLAFSFVAVDIKVSFINVLQYRVLFVRQYLCFAHFDISVLFKQLTATVVVVPTPQTFQLKRDNCFRNMWPLYR